MLPKFPLIFEPYFWRGEFAEFIFCHTVQWVVKGLQPFTMSDNFLPDMKEQKEIHIGSLIKEKMEERGLSVSDFAHALHYERTNIYKIFKRSSIDVDLLLRISEVLAYDFLREVYLADEPRRYSITIEADKEDIEEIRKWLLEKRRE